VSPASSSDELSNKELYPYFLRTAPADTMHVRGLMQLIERYGWTYVSVLYQDGSYGETAAAYIREIARNNDICFDAFLKVSQSATSAGYKDIARRLVAHRGVRVVIVFLYVQQFSPIVMALRDTGATQRGRFIWLCSDPASHGNFEDMEELGEGAISFRVWAPADMPDFRRWWATRSLSEYGAYIIANKLVATVLTAWLLPPQAELIQEVATIHRVELRCAVALPVFISSLSYNLFLVTACAYYAVQTRRLPDNYNESRYISFCVYTTLIMWAALLPAYYTVNSTLYKVVLLCLAISFNAYVALICQFVVKIYALYYVPNIEYGIGHGVSAGGVLSATSRVDHHAVSAR
ncbi:PREDICTED: metabotropic glutamate receptor 2-like, partial [Priapulus caudatus]|uniref:Metabotropic glutamate receptor 2-like n=1 Tax=Priapulus caudatus TaxID=37621 RepID=A0ABM1F6R0_PRICU